MQAVVDLDEIKKVIRESVKESIEIEMMKFRAEMLDYVSDEEQEDIEGLYGKPENNVEESVDCNF